MAEAGGWWEQLSVSSREALWWAHAYASLRPEEAEATSSASSAPVAAVDVFDLLAGLFLAHGGDSEPWDLFDHFGVPIGSVLSRAQPDPAALAAAREASEQRYPQPPVSSEVQAIIEQGVRSLAPTDGEGLLAFKLLFGALLETTNPASTIIRAQLDARGAPSAEIIASYHDYATQAGVEPA